MKPLQQIQSVLLALVLFLASGGHTLYSHFCKGEMPGSCKNDQTISLVEVSCKMKEQQEHKGCVMQQNNDDDCCDSQTSFETQDQISTSVDSLFLGFIAVLPQKFQFSIATIVQPQQQFVARFNKPPPRNNKPIIIQYQQFIC